MPEKKTLAEKYQEILKWVEITLTDNLSIKAFGHRVVPEIWLEILDIRTILRLFKSKSTVARIKHSWVEENLFYLSNVGLSEEIAEQIMKTLKKLALQSPYSFEWSD